MALVALASRDHPTSVADAPGKIQDFLIALEYVADRWRLLLHGVLALPSGDSGVDMAYPRWTKVFLSVPGHILLMATARWPCLMPLVFGALAMHQASES